MVKFFAYVDLIRSLLGAASWRFLAQQKVAISGSFSICASLFIRVDIQSKFHLFQINWFMQTEYAEKFQFFKIILKQKTIFQQ